MGDVQRGFSRARVVRRTLGALRELPPRYVWWVNVSLMGAVVVWALADPHFVSTARAAGSWAAGWFSGEPSAVENAPTLPDEPAVAFALVSVAIAASLLRLAVGLFGRCQQFRSLRALLVFTALTGGWFALAVQSSEIAWQGKRLRLSGHLAEFEALARPLRSGWPSRDGDSPELGPYMAYPIARPSTLILLTPPEISGSGASVCAVERMPEGGLLFQLSGAEAGDWLAWHPDSAQPKSFVGGLGDRHALVDSLELGRGWYLVRYRDA